MKLLEYELSNSIFIRNLASIFLVALFLPSTLFSNSQEGNILPEYAWAVVVDVHEDGLAGSYPNQNYYTIHSNDQEGNEFLLQHYIPEYKKQAPLCLLLLLETLKEAQQDSMVKKIIGEIAETKRPISMHDLFPLPYGNNTKFGTPPTISLGFQYEIHHGIGNSSPDNSEGQMKLGVAQLIAQFGENTDVEGQAMVSPDQFRVYIWEKEDWEKASVIKDALSDCRVTGVELSQVLNYLKERLAFSPAHIAFE